jgi:hypothetical protein
MTSGIFSSGGSTKKTQAFLEAMVRQNIFESLSAFGQQGVDALASVTPIETGLTASSWGYEIIENEGGIRINWTNDHIEDGVNIAVLIQYGHGTGTGGYISGIDYINPSMQPVFDQVIMDLWRRVSSA